MVATVLATAYGGGGLVRNVECVYDIGLWWIMFDILNGFGYWLFGRLVLRMGPFMQHFSIADTIGTVYGKYSKIVIALVSICTSIVIITGQVIVMSQAISICLESIDPDVITVCATLLLIFYSTFGGVRAVTYTDVFQFLTFSIIIPLLAWFVFTKTGKSVSEIGTILQSHDKFQFSNVFQFKKQLGLFLLLLSNFASYINSGIIQRVYMSSGPSQAKEVFSYAIVFSFIIQSFIILVSLFVFAGAPDLSKGAVWDYIIAHIPPLFKGFLSIGLLAMSMSTADSFLNVSAVIVGHDILRTIKKDKEITNSCQLKIARCTTLVVGLLSMLLVFCCKDLLKLMYWSLSFQVPIVSAPFILAIFGFRSTARVALIGMFTGVLAILSWNKWVEPITGMDGSFLAMLANGLAMMAAHYLLKQPEDTGWVKPDNTFRQIQQENSRKRSERKEAMKNAWENRKITLSNLIPSHTTIVSVGVYTTISNLMAYFVGCII